MDFITSLLVLSSITWTICLVLNSRKSKNNNKLPPPGPYQYPVIGNILNLGSKPHQSLAKLSQKHGPIMSLKLGHVYTVVVSSPEAAKTVLQKNDLAFSSRNIPSAVEALDHYKFSMVWLPVENQWRKLRKICREQMFSASRLDSSQGLRREKLDKLRDYVNLCCERGSVVDVADAAFTTSLNLMSSTLFSMEFAKFNSDSSQEMKDVVWGVMKCIGTPNISDYFPIFKKIDPQGVLKETEFYFGKLYAIFDRIIDDKLRRKSSGDHGDEKKNDLVDALIEINQRDEDELSRTDIRNLLLDLFVAGTDTTSSTVEWAMSELLRNPKQMSRLRQELDSTIEQNNQIEESDITKLPYLQAVVKETFRLHPPAPFLVPHKSESEVEINGYTIPKNTQVLVNVWASGRDPNVWPDPEIFAPERFIDGGDRLDIRGKDFELIPFGSGRRICPGLPLAYRMVHLMLATLVHGFEWRVEDGINAQEMDMSEMFGLTLQKATPLKAVPINRDF